MSLVEFRHVGIVVKNLDLMERFYTELGFELYLKLDESGQFIENVVGIKDVRITTSKFRLNGTSILELIKYEKPLSVKSYQKTNSNREGWSHLALTVNDYEKFKSILDCYGGKIERNPLISDCGKFQVVYCLDPEENIIEIVMRNQ